MSTLSSSTLFHYTLKMEYLIKILEKGFSPRICIENLPTDITQEIGIPMVCFCDIPLSQVENHSKDYGSYGIGLTKEWGQRKGITPVMYFHASGNTVKPFLIATDTFKHKGKKYCELMYITWFFKQYEGRMWKSKDQEYKENIRFYDEREWRYIPSFSELFDRENHMPMSYYGADIENLKNDNSFKEEINRGLENSHKLEFTPNDIKYLIVGKEYEIPEMIERLKKAKWGHAPNIIELLTTRIVSMESIKNDF